MMSDGQQQLQQLSQELQTSNKEIESLEVEVSDLNDEEDETDETIEAIETLETGSMVQTSLGGDVYLRVEVWDISETVVSLSANYTARQEQSTVIRTLRREQDTLSEEIANVRGQIEELGEKSDEIEERIV